jgi:hypothetical protein
MLESYLFYLFEKLYFQRSKQFSKHYGNESLFLHTIII